MKKLFFAIAAVAMVFATSCKKENVNAPEEPIADNEFVCVIDQDANPQNAPRIDDGMGTMAHIDASNDVWWQAGDKIAYWGKTVNASGTESADTGRFELTCSKMTDNRAYFHDQSGQNLHFYQGKHEAFYPASMMQIVEGKKVLTLPSEFTIPSDKNAAFLPMCGSGMGPHFITFYNICAVLKVTVPVECNKIELTATEALCGAIDYPVINQTATLKAGGGNKITVNGTFAANQLVYIAIPAKSGDETNPAYTNVRFKFLNDNDSIYQTPAGKSMKNIETNKVYPVTINMPSPVPADAFCFTVGALAPNHSTTKIRMDLTTFGCPEDAPNVVNLKYCTYDASETAYSSWQDYSIGDSIELSKGDKVYFMAGESGNINFAKDDENYYFFTAKTYSEIDVSGNIMYLLNQNPVETLTSQNSYAFSSLFYGMTSLRYANGLILPNNTAQYCYYRMFSGCANLIKAPVLRATDLESCCYREMFFDCGYLYDVTMSATNVSASGCLSSWLEDSGDDVYTDYEPTVTVNLNTQTSSAWYSTINTNTPSNWTITNGTTTLRAGTQP